MAQYVELTSDNKIIVYPYTFHNLQSENPYTNFGNNSDVAYWFPKTDAAIKLGYKLMPVFESPYPEFDHLTQYVIPGEIQCINDNWYTSWIVKNYNQEQQIYQDTLRKQENKQTAYNLLLKTDWTAIPSIADPAQSNPFLANQDAFLEYRSKVRQIAIDPPVVVEVWPVEPDKIWKMVKP